MLPRTFTRKSSARWHILITCIEFRCSTTYAPLTWFVVIVLRAYCVLIHPFHHSNSGFSVNNGVCSCAAGTYRHNDACVPCIDSQASVCDQSTGVSLKW
jgi:uncharacterized membrane protein YdbT with pleckstrin-like domain